MKPDILEHLTMKARFEHAIDGALAASVPSAHTILLWIPIIALPLVVFLFFIVTLNHFRVRCASRLNLAEFEERRGRHRESGALRLTQKRTHQARGHDRRSRSRAAQADLSDAEKSIITANRERWRERNNTAKWLKAHAIPAVATPVGPSRSSSRCSCRSASGCSADPSPSGRGRCCRAHVPSQHRARHPLAAGLSQRVSRRHRRQRRATSPPIRQHAAFSCSARPDRSARFTAGVADKHKTSPVDWLKPQPVLSSTLLMPAQLNCSATVQD